MTAGHAGMALKPKRARYCSKVTRMQAPPPAANTGVVALARARSNGKGLQLTRWRVA